MEKNLISGQALYRPVRQKKHVALEQGIPGSIATRSPSHQLQLLLLGKTLFDRSDTLANFYHNTGAFMAQTVFVPNNHRLSDTTMFPEMYITRSDMVKCREVPSADACCFDVDDDFIVFWLGDVCFNDSKVVGRISIDGQVLL